MLAEASQNKNKFYLGTKHLKREHTASFSVFQSIKSSNLGEKPIESTYHYLLSHVDLTAVKQLMLLFLGPATC